MFFLSCAAALYAFDSPPFKKNIFQLVYCFIYLFLTRCNAKES